MVSPCTFPFGFLLVQCLPPCSRGSYLIGATLDRFPSTKDLQILKLPTK